MYNYKMYIVIFVVPKFQFCWIWLFCYILFVDLDISSPNDYEWSIHCQTIYVLEEWNVHV